MNYEFYDYTDIIYDNNLTKDGFKNFCTELFRINTLSLDIYVVGSYAGYLCDGRKYNDVNFFILSKSIIEIIDLEMFMLDFHELCKKQGIPYTLFYCLNCDVEDINFDSSKYWSFKKPIDILTLYKPKLFRYINYKNTKMYKVDNFGSKKQTIKDKNKITTETKFYKPIKIS